MSDSGRTREGAQRTARRFLERLEARDLPGAEALLAPGFTMEFPGGNRFESLPALIDWSATRYRSVRKRFEGFDTLQDGAASIVYCFGTLAGEWPDGTPFSEVRFIDRFTVKDGKLVDQKVWNDLADHRR